MKGSGELQTFSRLGPAGMRPRYPVDVAAWAPGPADTVDTEKRKLITLPELEIRSLSRQGQSIR
jgi:hypothetical protein